MPIAIDIHPRGIIIRVSGDLKRSALGRQLGQVVPREHILSSPGQFIVPAEAAYQIATAFADINVTWSPAAWNLVSMQQDLHFRATSARIEVAEALSDPVISLADYPRRDILDGHQVAAVAAMTVPSLVGMALFDEQGLGKTIMALAAFDRLRHKDPTTRLLVVAPKSALASWHDDSAKLFGIGYKVQQISGDQLTRRRQFRAHADIVFCNYETVSADADSMRRTIVQSGKRWILVVDEAFFVKNSEARRSRAVHQVRTACERVIVLCGTPAPNAPSDLLNQLTLVNAGLEIPRTVDLDDKEQLVAIVTEALDATIYLRRLKHDVLPDLPEKLIERVMIDLSPTQRTMYEKAHDELVISVQGVDEQTFQRNLASFLARRIALTQICSHPGMLDPSYGEDPAKPRALDQLLGELIEGHGLKVVVWSFYRYSLEQIARRYAKYGLVRVDGSITRFQDRRDAITRFQNDPNVNIFLGNAAAAGAGITLTAAHHAIYESFSNQAVHYMQSVDRIHRRGQTQTVTSHILLARNTIEPLEFDRVQAKERAGRDLLGDVYEEAVTRERFLAELGTSLLNQ
jgi:SNF2 family DNA or RNA helicase